MESYMVVLLDPKECINIVKDYFKNNFNYYKLIKSSSYTGYWWVEYEDDEGTKICFDGDIGGHFFIKIIIGETEFNLWQYNRSVNQISQSTKENILHQLSILGLFLNKGTPT